MLVVSGFAESMQNEQSSNFIKGNRYNFNLFTQNESLDEQLETIESYMMKKGWDNIVIEEQELLDEQLEINNDIIATAIEAAKKEGIAGVVHHEPVA
ncbi:hypothetical protein ACFSJY_17970 [Thalassotalea euphylliae]|uniref:hypothetical protein n=1 Tax=Thalassotalea euphylliae TaxID=1655234 RepID=UPI00363A9199